MSKVSLACRSLGIPCEWAVESATVTEVTARFAEHAKCAHSMPELDGALRQRIPSAVRTV